ncbi:MAG: hypothetical protein AVDCRST_MAG91-2513, partial [uncultured Sphingomonadaceae bacterium]
VPPRLPARAHHDRRPARDRIPADEPGDGRDDERARRGPERSRADARAPPQPRSVGRLLLRVRRDRQPAAGRVAGEHHLHRIVGGPVHQRRGVRPRQHRRADQRQPRDHRGADGRREAGL